jgi:hypothetical protein
MRTDGGRNALRVVENREDIGVRKEAAQGLQNLLPTPHVEQPVVDDRRPHDGMIALQAVRLVPGLYFCCKICHYRPKALDFGRSHHVRWQRMLVEMETQPALDDILLNDIPTPKRTMVFPLGFPVEIVTNSDAVIAAARQSWGNFRAEHAEAPLSLCLTVTEHDGRRPPAQPKFRCHQHLMSIVLDARNHITCDFSKGCAFGWVTRSVAEQPEFLRLRFMESSVMSLLVAAHLAAIHGALVTRQGIGVALCGDSYAGKSSLAYACARSGWSFVSDDGTFLQRSRTDRFAVGNPHSLRFRQDAKILFPELADCVVGLRQNGALGMEVRTSKLPVSTLGGCSIDHLVFLRRSRTGRARMNRYDAGEALRWLERVELYGPAEVQASQRQAYRRLLDAGLWELHYSDLSDAVNLLEQLGAAA